MLPFMCCTIWSRLGLLFLASSAAACLICPEWQEPHCGTCLATHAFCSGCSPLGESPSMVVIFLPAAAETGVEHERTGLPLMCTVQAPHCAMPQPNLVPVSPSSSRITHSSGVSAGCSELTSLPLTTNLVIRSPPWNLESYSGTLMLRREK